MKSSAPGRRLFATGNSGATLREAVIKQGRGMASEGALCDTIGQDVCPVVYAVEHDCYVMEMLEPARREPGLLREMETLLDHEIWHRVGYRNQNWRDNLFQKTGVRAPDWVDSYQRLIHGDPTASNALRRGTDLVIGDPVGFRPYLPSFREIDMGKILQSAMGWETAAYGEEPVEWMEPLFWSDTDSRRRAMFWCGIACVRISLREKEPRNLRVVQWCLDVKERCFDAIGL